MNAPKVERRQSVAISFTIDEPTAARLYALLQGVDYRGVDDPLETLLVELGTALGDQSEMFADCFKVGKRSIKPL